MNKFGFAVIGASFAFAASQSQAATLKLTGTSAADGVLGFFEIEEATLVADTDKFIVASQFENFSFSNPDGFGFDLTPTSISGDSGSAIFDLVSGDWTIIGGSGNVLDGGTSSQMSVAGFGGSIVQFIHSGGASVFTDVSWTTEEIAATPIPLPAGLPLLLAGLAGLGLIGRNQWNNDAANGHCT